MGSLESRLTVLESAIGNGDKQTLLVSWVRTSDNGRIIGGGNSEAFTNGDIEGALLRLSAKVGAFATGWVDWEAA